jgi:WD40 repeat protein
VPFFYAHFFISNAIKIYLCKISRLSVGKNKLFWEKERRMKRNNCQLCTIFVAVIVMVFLTNTITFADNIYVSCGANGTIEKFDSVGNKSVFASGLANPKGLASNSSGNIFAACSGDGTIRKFDSSGSGSVYTLTYGASRLVFDNADNLWTGGWAGDGCLSISRYNVGGYYDMSTYFYGYMGAGTSYALAADGIGNIYSGYYAYTRGQIAKFTSNTSDFSQTWANTSFQQFDSPGGLAFDSSGNLYCADFSYGNIVKFDASGNMSGFASGLANPQGLAFDSSGNLFVACSGDGTIRKFDSNGNMSVFATGLNAPTFITVQTPEPATMLLLSLGGLVLRRKHRG